MATQPLSSLPSTNPHSFTTAPSSLPPAAPPPAQGWGSWVYNGATSAICYIPKRIVGAAAATATDGAANRATDLLSTNQPELTNRIRDLVSAALLRRAPEHYHSLLQYIQTLLQTPSAEALVETLQLLDRLSEAEIRSLVPDIPPDAVQVLLSLKVNLTSQVRPQADSIPVAAQEHLQAAADILAAIIGKHEGVLPQAIDMVTQSIGSREGPIAALRAGLTSRAASELREIKTALESYGAALSRRATFLEFSPLIQNLQAKLEILLSNRTLAPQITLGQWGQLELFQATAGEALNNQSSEIAGWEAARSLITTTFNGQRGVIEEATDLLVEGIGRGVEQLAPLPARMVQGLFSPEGQGTSPAPQAGPSLSTLNMGSILTQGQGLLSSLLRSAGESAAQTAAQGLATLLALSLEKLGDHIRATQEYGHLLQTIDPLIRQLRDPNTQSSWQTLTGALGNTLHFMQDQQVYLQGLRLPLGSVQSHTSAIPSFLNHINAHQNILQPASQRSPEQITPEMIREQGTFLKMRSASLAPAKLVVETICGLSVSPAFYAEIYRPSLSLPQTDLSSIFRQRVFDQIDRAEINFLRKWVAKRLYDLFHAISSFYVHAIMDNIFKKVTDWMKPDLPGKASKGESLVNLARNWLAVMSGSYNHVAESPSLSSEDFSTMMEKTLQLPERSGGLSQQQLYAAVATAALDTFGPTITWSEKIDGYFRTEIPADSSFYCFNPLVKVLSTICNFCLQGIVSIPQWISNQVLKVGAKLALTHTSFVKDYSETTIESLRRNTPSSYALHQMIYKQMQKVLVSLQKSLQSQESAGGSILDRNTNIQRVQMEGLVRYAMEVVNKGQYRTQDSLRDYLNRRDPLRHQAEHEIENTFLPEIMPTAIEIISVAMQTMTEEKEMQEMFYHGLQMANDVFTDSDSRPISDADFASLEQGIRGLTDQILETAILHTLEEKFDFTNEKQKKGIAQLLSTLKNQAQDFATHLCQNAEEIANGGREPDAALQRKTRAMIELSSRFNKAQVDALSLAGSNTSFHTQTKYKVNDLFRDLSAKCAPLSEKLNTLKVRSDEMSHSDKLLSALLDGQQIHRGITARLRAPHPLAEDLSFCKQEIAHLREHLTILRQNECPLALYIQIQTQAEELSTAIQAIETLQQTQKNLEGARLLFETLKMEKLRTIGTPISPQLIQQERRLTDLLHTLPFPDQKALLIQQVRSLLHSVSPEGVLSVAIHFDAIHFGLCASNATEKTTRLELTRRATESFQTQINTHIEHYAHIYAGKRQEMITCAPEIATLVREINTWVGQQQELPIWNLFAFDMEWVTENVKSLAVDRARAKINLLFDALYQKHNYIGFINQVMLLPFLKNFGKHHLLNQS